MGMLARIIKVAQLTHRVLKRGRPGYVMMKQSVSYVTDAELKMCYDTGSENGERAHEAKNTGSP